MSDVGTLEAALLENRQAETYITALVEAVRAQQQRVAELEAALKPFADNWDLHAARHQSIAEQWYRLLEDDVARDMIAAINHARNVLSHRIGEETSCRERS